MKSRVIFFILLIAFKITYPAVAGEQQTKINLSEDHSIDHLSLSNNNDLWIHSLEDYQVVEVLLRDQCSVNVREVKSIGSPYDIFRKSSISKDVVLLNGGYFGRTKKGNPTPIGLVRSNGKRLSSIIPWKSGGFLVSSRKKSDILLASTNGKALSKWDNAIQSKPILNFK